MVGRSKFIIAVSVEGLSWFGADTIIYLFAMSRQATFREITNQRLKRILLNIDPLTVAAVKMILGSSHLEHKEYGRDNMPISSWFLASLLNNRVPKMEAKELLVRLFRKDLVGGVEEVLKAAILGIGILHPVDLELLQKTDEDIRFYPSYWT